MTSPRRWFVPLEESPRRQPHRVTAAVAPLAVPPVSSHRPCRLRSRAENPDAPADPMGSDRPMTRSTSTHPPGGLLGDRSHRERPQAIDRAPAPDIPARSLAGSRRRRLGQESRPLQGLAPPTSSCATDRSGYRNDPHGSSWASFPFKVLAAPGSAIGRPACAGPEDGNPSRSSPGFRSRGGPALPESVRSRRSR